MSFNDSDDVDMSSVEFTLEDTYEHLSEVKNENKKEVVELMNIVKNNEARTLGPNVSCEEIRLKRMKFIRSMEKFVANEQPTDLPIPNTLDIYINTVKELEDEVRTMEDLSKMSNEEISEIERDIIYMEKKKAVFEQMKEASLNAADTETTTDYKAEAVATKEMFKKIKQDLQEVVEILFPDNIGFQTLLRDLTRALTKGGDDLYIEVMPEFVDFVNFLEEADIVQFHPHDKNKIKLVDL